ncbi:fatty acyl-CoA reductase 1-like isoform X2 [Mizuhopecten yessoensis]|uniref:Fatty acyl-CoA reductase n=1 Tax=Mizuhopecten yessoensis TaxID=6573 RepID=A0A210Q395_MIZYE|nr:fatty acyl-CoA reductase 1-like isoform X2 [Mizuhopecten yessoensis]OWF43207.1 Fatty acyl-CoA reductase 1 [Mizuhopecten yessoensis]
MEEGETVSAIANHFAGKNIFITGGTGFLGKVLVEKLLRSCPDIGTLYLLMRPKNSQDIYERSHELIEKSAFEKLRNEQPEFHKKIHPINGDIAVDDLGVSEEDAKLLQEKVDVVFHGAATVRFDEPLRFAVEMNLLGIRRMVKFCRKFKHLEVFLHMSTAYANCDKPFIEEMIYNPPVDPQRLIDALEWMDDEMVEKITPKLIGNKPNTYTYTKQLGEHLLVKEGSDLPLAIVRPSIVGAAWKEPYPGWIDNYNGPSGLYIAAGKGILRSVKGDFRCVADIVPVDMPVNMMIAAAWYTAVNKPSSTLIYHCTTGSTNPFTWGEMEGVVMNFWKKVPLDSCFRRPKISLTMNSMIHDYWVFVSHMIPAYFADMGYCLMGKRPRMVKIYNKLHRAMNSLTFFTTHSWEWTYNNLDMLKSQMTPEDKRRFYFDPRVMHWPTYLENYCLGTKKFLLNEDLSGLPAARAHLRKLRNIRYTFNTILLVALWRVLIARSQIARNLWFFIMGLVMKFVKYTRITSTIGGK